MVLTYELRICRKRHWELNGKNRLDGKESHSGRLPIPHYPQPTTATNVHIFVLHQCFTDFTGTMQRIRPSACSDGAFRLRTVVVLTNGKTALLTHAVGPEALDGDRADKVLAKKTVMVLADLLRHGIVGEQEPEAKDSLGEDVQNGVGDNLGIDANVAGAIRNTPDTIAY